MNFKEILLKEKEGVVTIILNRPETLNAFNVSMRKELWHILRNLETEETVRVLVITGAGRGFCSGGDVKTQRNELAEVDLVTRSENIRLMNDVILKIRNFRTPVIAYLNGSAVGAGLSLALACDIRIASEEAKFGVVFVKRGLHPDTGTSFFLPRLVGTSKTCELIFTGNLITAEEAKEIGLVDLVVQPADLEEKVYELASKIAQGPPIAIRMAKNIIYKGLTMDLSSVLEWETLAQVLCLQTKDHQEGLDAFFEKRNPVFNGK